MPRLVPRKLLAALRAETAGPLELPLEVLRTARHRVRVAGALGLLGYAAFLLFELTGASPAGALEHAIRRTHDLLGIALSGAVLLVAAAPQVPDRSVLRVALAGEVLLCALISTLMPWAQFVRLGALNSLTWVVPVILLVPILVPAPPRTMVLVSTVCALTMPLGPWLLSSLGLIEARPSELLGLAVSGAVAVGIAAVAARTIHGARRQLAALRSVGSYELLEKLGQGGMGEVWKAKHSMLARPAAVKLIRPEQLQGASEAREEAIARFTGEAQITAGLSSPHTVSLFDFGQSEDGALYYAMELLDGMNLEHFVYQYGPIEPRRAVHWLQQVCDSLGEAHARGLVHRDIKPANLFVCRYGRELDFLKVLDFGLHRPVGEATDARLTSPGIRMGTPAYMAPEQVFDLAPDPRSDLYALGCVGYWLIAGSKPFEAESAGELMRHHAQTPAPRLSSKAEQPVPAPLEAALMACLAKDVSERPADADELSARLARSIEGAAWTRENASAWWKSRRG